VNTTPRSLRLQIGLFGRTNVGKSSFLNMVVGQDVAITSPVPGTTTDVVEKPMELLPVGPVVFLDTAGIDDVSVLADLRLKKSMRILDRADVFILITEPNIWTEYEEGIIAEAAKRSLPCILAINKADTAQVSPDFRLRISGKSKYIFECMSLKRERRDEQVNQLKKFLLETAPDDFLNTPTLLGDILPSGGIAVFIVPIDLQAPRGRLILPQVQAIRDVLDNDAAVMVVKEREYASVLARLREPPSLVVCDSQVVLKMVADTPVEVPCTTFSILFSRFKGDLTEAARGAHAISSLADGDRVLIGEACSHHAIEDDIGRVKIPRWLRQYAGADIRVESTAGRDFPEDLREYKLVVHCGGCMITRSEMLFRMQRAREAGVAITNYGVCISYLQGVAERVLSPFPAALDALRHG
jgi:[FeFe] hydrogenase H-cluster maturation GTPase HydF